MPLQLDYELYYEYYEYRYSAIAEVHYHGKKSRPSSSTRLCEQPRASRLLTCLTRTQLAAFQHPTIPNPLQTVHPEHLELDWHDDGNVKVHYDFISHY